MSILSSDELLLLALDDRQLQPDPTHPESSSRTVFVALRLSGVEDRSHTPQVLTGDFVAEAVCPD